LVRKLADIKMYGTERSYKYIERYTTLLNRLGYSVKAHDRVVECERGLTAPLRSKLAEFKASQHASTGLPYECKSIMHLRDLVAILEKGQVALPGKDGGTNPRYKYNNSNNNEKTKYPKRRYDEMMTIAPTPDTPTAPKVSTIKKDTNHTNNHNRNNNKRVSFNVSSVTPTKTKWPNATKSTKYAHNNNNNKKVLPPCSHCGLTNHPTADCHYPEGCKTCGKQGHRYYNCPTLTKPSPPNMYAINNMSVQPQPEEDGVDRSIQLNNMSYSRVGITSPNGGTVTTNVLLDTGAQLSAINANIVKRNRLYIHPIKASDPQSLSLASAGQYVKRLGYVSIPLIIVFSGSRKAPVKLHQKLEVLNMSYDYLLGIDVLPSLFPHDEIMRYMGVPDNNVTVDSSVNTLSYGGPDNKEPLVERNVLHDYLQTRGTQITMNRLITAFGNMTVGAVVPAHNPE